MRQIGLFVAMLTVLSLIVPVQSLAQPGMRGRENGCCGGQTQYGPMYNPQTVETLSREVVSINTTMPMQRMAHGVHFTLKTPN